MASLIDVKQVDGYDSGSVAELTQRIQELETFTQSVEQSFYSEQGLTGFSQSLYDSFQALELQIAELELFSSSLNSGYVTHLELQEATLSILNDYDLISSSNQIASEISSAFSEPSAAFDFRISHLESFSTSLDTNFISEAELTVFSGSIYDRISQVDTDFAVQISGVQSDILTLSQSFSNTIGNLDVVLDQLELFSSSLDAGFVTHDELESTKSIIDADIAGKLDTSSFNSYVSNTTMRIDDIEQYTIDTNTRVDRFDGRLTTLEEFSESYVVDSASFDFRIDSLEDFSNSVDVTFIDVNELEEATQSILDNYGLVSGSHISGSIILENDIYISGNTILGNNDDNVHQITGSLKLKNSIFIGESLLQTFQNQNVAGNDNQIASVSSSLYTATFFEYVIHSGSNLRAGNLVSTHYNGQTEYYDQSTQDIGDTSTVILRTEVQGDSLVLLANSNLGIWNIKTFVKGL
jgi:hypothetical protein